MKKKIVKVSVITLLITLGVYFMVLSVVTLCFPSKTAEFYSSMGLDKTACRLYEVSYKRKPSVNKLKKVIDYSYLTKNDKKLVKYSDLLFEDEDFERTYEDGDGYYARLVYMYVKAYYNLEKEDVVEKTVEVVIEEKEVKNGALDGEVLVVPANNDEIYNGIRVLSIECYKNEDLDTLKALKGKLDGIMADYQDDTEVPVFKEVINIELDTIKLFIAELEQAE